MAGVRRLVAGEGDLDAGVAGGDGATVAGECPYADRDTDDDDGGGESQHRS